MQLVDQQIRRAIRRGEVGVSPFDDRLVQPASIDLRLGYEFHRMMPMAGHLDPCKPGGLARWGTTDCTPHGPPGKPVLHEFRIRPGQFVLAATMERIRLPADLVGRVEGKSSIGRLGLSVHTTAGFIDPGFDGNITLELHLTCAEEMVLRPWMPIAQLTLARTSAPAERPYGAPGLGSHYQGQTGATQPFTSGLAPVRTEEAA